MTMARRHVCSSGMATVLLVMSSVLMTTFTDAAAILPPNQTPVKLYSRLTEQLVTALADGTIHANGASRNSDTNLIMETVGQLRRFRRRDSDIYISITPEGELKALAEGSINGSSSYFLPIESIVSHLSYFRFQTTVQYLESSTTNTAVTSPSRNATCYIAIDDFLTGDPPCNVCNVPGNDFAFDDEDTLLFQIDLSNGPLW